MGGEEASDPFKGVDWKAVGSDMQKDPSSKPVIRRRLPRKFRPVPEHYFLPRRPWPSAIAFYGSFIVGGIGAGMLVEMWINKKIKGMLFDSSFLLLSGQSTSIKCIAKRTMHFSTLSRGK